MPSKLGMPDQLELIVGKKDLLRSANAVSKENISRNDQFHFILHLHVINNTSLAMTGSVDASA